jgi:hypothetical protein
LVHKEQQDHADHGVKLELLDLKEFKEPQVQVDLLVFPSLDRLVLPDPKDLKELMVVITNEDPPARKALKDLLVQLVCKDPKVPQVLLDSPDRLVH